MQKQNAVSKYSDNKNSNPGTRVSCGTAQDRNVWKNKFKELKKSAKAWFLGLISGVKVPSGPATLISTTY